LLRGIKVFLYPTPLHYRVIPDLVYDTDATIMLGTDTFYNGYAHYAHPYDFWNIRIAVAGAEKLRDSTRRLYSDKFRLNILEGYGVTEAGPVVSVNTPMENKVGTVGRSLSAIECRLQKVEGLDRGGRLLLKGPNLMLGYMKADKPGVVQKLDDWYDTGDIVDIDEDGFIIILGRAKRFAKIGGEMVSLVVTEDIAIEVMPEVSHAAITIPDERKGEQIVLFTESKELTREHLVQRARAMGIAEICLPKHVEYIESIPRLGNGKIDYITLSGLRAVH
jgi:acyl-[acyl-carrier-protein]-phospholipid O-acyltransferase/long-chain-fatty-acid--[acyl-carrier-protein] ligase